MEFIEQVKLQLGKMPQQEKENYLELIEYYQKHQDLDQARQVGERALEKCKEDLTDIFIFLLKDALEHEELKRYNKLYASAKRRRTANIVRIDQALPQGIH